MAEPPLQFYMMKNGSTDRYQEHRPGRWVAEDAWPSKTVSSRVYSINSNSLDAVPLIETARLLSSPQTTGLSSGEQGSFAIVGDLPGDQSLDAFGSLQFDTAILDEAVEILGNVEVEIELSSDRRDALLAARLIDVAPDGRAYQVTLGFLNLTHRDSSERPEALIPGKRYRVRMKLFGVGYTFVQGHRIRLALSSAYWPMVWPSPEHATLTVYTGSSQLTLPIRKASEKASEQIKFPPPLKMDGIKKTVLRPGLVERSVTDDQVTGEITHRLFIDGGVFGDWGRFLIDDIGLETEHCYERTYSIKPSEPNSAKAKMTQSYDLSRGGWKIKVTASADMTSTPTTFELFAWIEAFEGNELVRRREWKASIPRDLV
ncbi:CocE/NonD family hydrolase C-terminal non-catalytic domain-containing protein [Mesorhizobium waimense]|nr:CocE/NonD family hydrolase C-terminal non-catalytic domain-containing protein [Mesorhizobium waimense]